MTGCFRVVYFGRRGDRHRFEVAGLVMTKVGDGEYRATLPRGSK